MDKEAARLIRKMNKHYATFEQWRWEGVQARRQGKMPKDNPYPSGTKKAEYWYLGWYFNS